jgi:hypothetical protein
MQEVLGAVALETGRTLQVSPSGEADARYVYYAKSPLYVRSDRSFELIVPSAWTGRVGIAWGNSGGNPITSHLQVAGCPPMQGSAWLVYPGGFYVAKPACIPIRIETSLGTTMVHVAVGSPCH